MAHTITRKALRQNIIQRLYRPRYPITSTTTTIAADKSEIIDAVLTDGDAHERGMRDAYVYIAETVASGPVYGEARKLLGLSASNKWEVATEFSDIVQTGTDYELHYKFHPSVINDKIDRLLEELRVPAIIPLSVVRNPDFSIGTSTSPTFWTLNNVAFLREEMDAAEEQDFMFFGPTSNRFTANGASPAVSLAFPTIPGKDYFVTVPILSTDGDKITVTLESPAGTALETGSTSWGFETGGDSYQHSVIHFSATIPADQYLAVVKVVSENTDSVWYMPHVIVTPTGDDQFPSPLHRDLALRDSYVITFPMGGAIKATDSAENFMWLDQQPTLFSHIRKAHSYHGGLRRVSLEKKATGAPMYLVGEESFPAFVGTTEATKDAEVTWAPGKLLEYLAVQELMEEWAEREDEAGNAEASARLYSRAKNIKGDSVVPESRRVFGLAEAMIKGTL